MTVAAGEPRPGTAPANPFKFLDYYDEDDRLVFAGRSEEILQLMTGLNLGRTFVLYGRSGLGKTSLLKAGLFPRLRQTGYLPLYVRILDDPVGDTCATVARTLGCESVSAADLPQLLARGDRRAGAPIVLVLDQFEEFFIRFAPRSAHRAQFSDLLRAILAEPDSSLRVLFSLREDHLAELEELRAAVPGILTHSYRLLPLTAYGARQAILSTLDTAGVAYDDDVANALVNRLEHNGFNPLELQIYCSEVFDEAKRRSPDDVRLHSEDLQRVGRIEDIYERYLGLVLEGLDNDAVVLTCCVLDVLRTADRTKRAVRIADLASDGPAPPAAAVYFSASHAQLARTFQHLAERRLIRSLPSREQWFELLHDGIVEVLLDWLQRNRDFRRFRDAARLVENLHRVDSTLSERQLRLTVDPFRALLRLAPDQTEFLFRSSVLETAGSLEYWAARLDREREAARAEAMVLGLLSDADSRGPAATAAGRLRLAAAAPACVDLALGDPDAAVRSAAARTVVSLGALPERALVRSALRSSGRRRNALELLAELTAANADLRSYGGFIRYRAHKLAVARQLKPHDELIAGWTFAGVMTGAVAGVLWVPIFGAVISILSMASSVPSVVTRGLGLAAMVAVWNLLPWAIPGALSGALCGWYARRSVEQSLLNGRETWRVSKPWAEDVGTFAAAWIIVSLLADRPAESSMAAFVVHFLPAAVLFVCTMVVSWRWRLAEDRGMRMRSEPSPWWSLALVLPVVFLGVAALARALQQEFPLAPFVAALLCWVAMRYATCCLNRVVPSDPVPWQIGAIALAVGAAFTVAASDLLVLASDVGTRDRPHWLIDLLLACAAAVAVLSFRLPVATAALGAARRLWPLSSVAPPPPRLPLGWALAGIGALGAAALVLAPHGWSFLFPPTLHVGKTPIALPPHDFARYYRLQPAGRVPFAVRVGAPPSWWAPKGWVEGNAPRQVVAGAYSAWGGVEDVLIGDGEPVLLGLDESPFRGAFRGGLTNRGVVRPQPLGDGNLSELPEQGHPVLAQLTMACQENGSWTGNWRGRLPPWFSTRDRLLIYPIAAFPGGDGLRVLVTSPQANHFEFAAPSPYPRHALWALEPYHPSLVFEATVETSGAWIYRLTVEPSQPPSSPCAGAIRPFIVALAVAGKEP